MSETYVFEPDFSASLVIGATGMTAILQNIRVIVSTCIYSVPLDRGFAHDNAFLDSPAPIATARLTSALMDAIEKYEPRVEVEEIDFSQNSQGNLIQGTLVPVIKFHLKEGTKL